jgi:uncharacterized protein
MPDDPYDTRRFFWSLPLSETRVKGSLRWCVAIDDKFREFAGNFLKASSTGVDRLSVDRAELSKSEMQALVPEAVLSNLLEGVDLQHSAVVRLPNGRDLLVERKSDGHHFYQVTIQADSTEHVKLGIIKNRISAT